MLLYRRASAANLQVLDLTMASVASQLPLLLALETAQQLSALSLASTQLADDFLPALFACSSLQILNLSLNPAITAAGLNATLPGFARQLQRLDLRGTGVGNTVLPVLKHLPQLQQLVLADTAITWESKAAAAAEGLDGAVVGNARVPAGGRAGDAAGLPAWQAASAAGAPIVQCRGPGKPAAGWASLRMLDVTNAKLTEAGVVELVGELVEAAAGGASRSSECGLQALHVGGMAGKLGRKALTNLSRLTSLQQLTLQVGDSGSSCEGVQAVELVWLMPVLRGSCTACRASVQDCAARSISIPFSHCGSPRRDLEAKVVLLPSNGRAADGCCGVPCCLLLNAMLWCRLCRVRAGLGAH